MRSVMLYNAHNMDADVPENTLMWPQMHTVTAEELRIGSLTDAVACRMAARDAG